MHLLVLLLSAAFLNQAYAARLGPELDAQVPATNFAFGAFNYQSCSSSSNLICTGSVRAADGFLMLTPEPTLLPEGSTRNLVGRVLYREPVAAWPAFVSTTFTVRIVGAPNSPAGDGMTFIFAPDNSSSPAGFNLGIVPDSDGASDIRQLVVELDTYKNDFDMDGNHIAVETTRVDKPLIAATLNGSGIDLKSGKDITFKIDYNSWTKWLEVHAAYDSNPLVKILSLQIDIAATIPNFVYVGFTAATGYFTESHQLLSWKFKSTTKLGV
ncbi:probable L-type lectin-domain containing receptor kinase S.5 [Tripterygium wilfordii]|uniref:probable L-type lectin-domain containing receptor kinase S.5 n=1 Tax=Tripterygium wilfordii TaxID=458696 RepID=UPI0018F84872|nr:probable L-type lectin-domain containing receptor kinase S.5 [Tripterygium wilfordii]